MRKYVSVLVLGLMLGGCATAHYDVLQTRQIESKEFDADVRTTFEAIKVVLQDNNYMIHSSDFQGGLVTGIGASHLVYDFFKGGDINVSNVVNINFNEVGKDRTSVRMNLTKRSSNGHIGTIDEAIVDPDMMHKIYADIQKEILVKQNLNK